MAVNESKRSRPTTFLAGGAVVLVMLLSFLASSIPPASGESLGSWSATTSYPIDTSGAAACVTYSGYMYCVGGDPSGGPTQKTYYGALTSSGIPSWTQTTNYPIGIELTSCVVSGSDSWCLGGENSAYEGVTQVYYAALSPSGIGAWTNATSTAGIPVKSSEMGCVASGGYIYCVGVGAFSGSSATYYGQISGSTISWHAGTSYPIAANFFNQNKCLANSGYVYCFGTVTSGSPPDSVYSASISSSGFGSWNNETDTAKNVGLAGLYVSSCTVDPSGYAECVGTDGTLQDVYYASISGGTVGSWTITNPYPVALGGGNCGIVSSYLYCTGYTGSSSEGTDPSYYASIQAGSTTTITVTSTVTSTFTTTLPGTTTTTTRTVTGPTTTSTTTSTVTSTVTSVSTSTTTLPGTTTTSTPTVTSTPTTTVTSTSTSTATQTQTVTATTTPTVTSTTTETSTATSTTTVASTTVTEVQTVPGPTTTTTSTVTRPVTTTSTATETQTQTVPGPTTTQTVTSPPTTVTSTQTNTVATPTTLTKTAPASTATATQTVTTTVTSASGSTPFWVYLLLPFLLVGGLGLGYVMSRTLGARPQRALPRMRHAHRQLLAPAIGMIAADPNYGNPSRASRLGG
jgi:hypothetical protein